MNHKYTDEQITFLRKNSSELTRKELTERFNAQFNTALAVVTISSFCKRNKFRAPSSGRFIRGQLAHNKRPVGSEKRVENGYVHVKVGEPDVWKYKHVLAYEQYYGVTVPKTHCVIFIDGDNENLAPSNLQMVTRKEVAVFNKSGYCRYPVELTPTLRTLTQLQIKISDKARVL